MFCFNLFFCKLLCSSCFVGMNKRKGSLMQDFTLAVFWPEKFLFSASHWHVDRLLSLWMSSFAQWSLVSKEPAEFKSTARVCTLSWLYGPALCLGTSMSASLMAAPRGLGSFLSPYYFASSDVSARQLPPEGVLLMNPRIHLV